MSTAESPRHHSAREHIRETVVLVVLSVTAVLTAWCGFESAKWGGAMSTSFSAASSSRIQAARYDSAANSARQADLSIWTVYVQATAQDDTALKSYVEKRFTPAFAVAYRAWRAADEPTNGPFAMPEYVPPGSKEATAADARADRLFATALADNQRGDNYTALTVLLALVLFFAAVSSRLGRPRAQWVMIGVSLFFLITATVVAATLPVTI